MSIDEETVERLAKLAKLSFSPEEKVRIKADLTRILDFIDKLNEVDTQGVEPMIYMNEHEDVLREDVVNFVVSQKEALSNSPDKDSDYIKVPKVLKK